MKGRTVSVDGITVVVPQLAAHEQTVSANAEFSVQDFFSVSGSLAIQKSTRDLVVLDSTTPIPVEMLTIGGSDINAFVGTNPRSDDAVGLTLTGVAFGVMFASASNSQDGNDKRFYGQRQRPLQRLPACPESPTLPQVALTSSSL